METRIRWALVALVFLIALGEAAAQPVYRCAAEGGVTFQDRPCAGGERLALESEAPDEVAPAVVELVARYEKRRASTARASTRAPRRAAERPAFRCTTTGGEVAILDRPCPKPRSIDGKAAEPVREERITQREACEGRWAQMDPYDRHKRGWPKCR